MAIGTSLADTRSAELYRRAVHALPGGVNSPVRAMRAIGRDPIFVRRASGAEIVDVDGNRYVDYVCSWGPLIHGHAHPKILAAILYHRRAGFSANGMGVWKVPEADVLRVGPRMAAFRGISHCYQRPTYQDWPYSVFTMAHGRSKEECDAILDAIAAQVPEVEDRATLYSSTEFKKIRLLYFTEDFKRWEAEHS